MAVARLDISSRSDFARRESFDDVGPYELVEGTAYFAVDPQNARNQGITDLDLAPRDASGKVRFSGKTET